MTNFTRVAYLFVSVGENISCHFVMTIFVIRFRVPKEVARPSVFHAGLAPDSGRTLVGLSLTGGGPPSGSAIKRTAGLLKPRGTDSANRLRRTAPSGLRNGYWRIFLGDEIDPGISSSRLTNRLRQIDQSCLIADPARSRELKHQSKSVAYLRHRSLSPRLSMMKFEKICRLASAFFADVC